MTARLRENAPAALGACAGASVLGWLALYGFGWNDYDLEASAAVKALTGGHLVRFAQLAPAYGGSIVLRAPFAFLPGLWGGGDLAVYRALAAPCLLATVALAVALVARMRADRRSLLARGTVIGLCVANPISLRALEIGHPEELLAGVLCVAAVLAAIRRQATWAGLVLGLAIATKTWALVAVPPVLATLDGRRLRSVLVAAAVAVAVLAPLAAAGDGLTRASGGVTAVDPIFQPWQPWWWLGHHGTVVRGSDGQPKPGYRAGPGWIPSIVHLLIVLLAIPLAAAWRRRGPPESALLLLALVLLARCWLDPWNSVYYCVPFLLALLAWEARTRALPVATISASAAAWVLFQELPRAVSPDAQSAVYVTCAGVGTALLAARLYGRRSRLEQAAR